MSAPKKKTAAPPVDPASLALLLRQTRSLLVCHQELGLSEYPATPELRTFAASRSVPRSPVAPSPTPPNHNKTTGPQNQHPLAQKKIETPSVPPQSQSDAPKQLKTIAEELPACRDCPSGASAMQGQGSSSPRLVVVGDCFIGSGPRHGMLWGEEADALFWKMMAAIQLDRKTVYVTNLVKCTQNKTISVGDQEQIRCLPWLERELRALQPRLICAMGDTAARVLLKSDTLPLRHLGHLHPCRCPQNSTAQVLPTFHPRVLLQYPEMKQAAWQHLQVLQRQF